MLQSVKQLLNKVCGGKMERRKCAYEKCGKTFTVKSRHSIRKYCDDKTCRANVFILRRAEELNRASLKEANKTFQKGKKAIVPALIFFLAVNGLCFGEISRAQAVSAIVGEAENSGMKGMIAVGEAIRNRGHLRGVYGTKSPRLKVASPEIKAQARKAWDKSRRSNLTKKSTGWGSSEDVKKWKKSGYWSKVTPTVTIGGNHFYKEKK
jgi:hypothetical protein